MAVASAGSSSTDRGQRPKVPEPQCYEGARDAKELENFLFDMEQYFRAVHTRDAKLWWRSKFVDDECSIKTWTDLKRELKNQFFSENVDYMARKRLRELVQTGTVREFVRNFSTLMLDIRDMSEKDKLFHFIEGLKPWARTELQRQRVQDVTTAMAAAERLHDFNDGSLKWKNPPPTGSSSNLGTLPDIGKPFEVQTDASDFAIGGVLLQQHHPVAFESRKLSEAERKYTAQEKKLLAVIHCLRTWRHYLLGAHFVVKTDNTAVSHFLTQPRLTAKQARRPELAALRRMAPMVASRATTDIHKLIGDHLGKDPLACAILKLVEEGKSKHFWKENGVLWTKGPRVFVPRAGGLRQMLMRECHDTPWAGHPGWQRTLALLKQGYYWPQMRQDVGNLGAILVVIDRFSKYATFIPALKYCTAEDTARLLFKHVVKYWGLPQNIVSDRNPKFTGAVQWIVRGILEAFCPRQPKELALIIGRCSTLFLRKRDRRLVRKYEGPVRVLSKVGNASYKIDPPKWMKFITYVYTINSKSSMRRTITL
ncbi:uncharacterized protein LOC111306411 [Durio zibethinus]|uniref:Uncharacterized protein LOC111306411 n=1 Tax=Durio zibethinus TaxID=66656 RepID=A0A6P6A4W3_DURZI|nr:uncharacterized protein LOC111306411 [Durio zibethinus]